MATESKSEKKKRSSASTSEGRDVSKRRRTSDDEEKSGRGSSRREKGEHGKSHKRSKHHSDKEKKSKEKLKNKDSKHSGHSITKPHELSSDDYFSKNNEFATWLKEDKGIFFSDLSSERARELFSSFVKKWNSDKLEPKFYEGIATAPRTAHNWKIRN